MVGINIDNFDVDSKFVADVRAEYDELRSAMGVPVDGDVPDDHYEEDEDKELGDDGERPAGASAGSDAAAAAAAHDIAAEE